MKCICIVPDRDEVLLWCIHIEEDFAKIPILGLKMVPIGPNFRLIWSVLLIDPHVPLSAHHTSVHFSRS